MEIYHKIIEVTGVPGGGKTTFIKENFSDQVILLGGIPISYGMSKRIIWSIFLSFYAIVTRSITLQQIWWLMKKAATYDERLCARLNALRNSMTKFGYHFFTGNKRSTMVDEGISHIPFILGLDSKEICEFMGLFRQHLEKMSIIFVETPQQEVLRRRIITRGHKRVKTEYDAESFVDKNSRIAVNYKKSLIDAGFDVTFK